MQMNEDIIRTKDISDRTLMLAVIIIHTAFFVYSLFWGNIYVGDYKEYLAQAENIGNHGNWYAGDLNAEINPDLYSRRPPLYGFAIFVIKSVAHTDYAVTFVQSCLSILNIAGLLKLLKKHRFRIPRNKILLAILLFYPSQFIYCNFIMSEIFFQTFLFWSFFYFVRFVRDCKPGDALIFNTLLALAALTKPVLYLFWILNSALVLIIIFKTKSSFAPLIYSLILPAAVLAVCLYNYGNTGYFHYSSLRHSNILEFHSRFLIINESGIDSAMSKNESEIAALDTITDHKTRSLEAERLGREVIMDNFANYLRFYFRGCLNFFTDPGRFDIGEFFRISPPKGAGIYYRYLKDGYKGVVQYLLELPLLFTAYLAAVFLINILLIASSVSFVFDKSNGVYIRMYFLMLILYLCAMTGIVGALRYKLPVLIMMLYAVPFFAERTHAFFDRRKISADRAVSEKR